MKMNGNLTSKKISCLTVVIVIIMGNLIVVPQSSYSQVNSPNNTSLENQNKSNMNGEFATLPCYFNGQEYSKGATVNMPGGVKKCSDGPAWT